MFAAPTTTRPSTPPPTKDCKSASGINLQVCVCPYQYGSNHAGKLYCPKGDLTWKCQLKNGSKRGLDIDSWLQHAKRIGYKANHSGPSCGVWGIFGLRAGYQLQHRPRHQHLHQPRHDHQLLHQPETFGNQFAGVCVPLSIWVKPCRENVLPKR